MMARSSTLERNINHINHNLDHLESLEATHPEVLKKDEEENKTISDFVQELKQQVLQLETLATQHPHLTRRDLQQPVADEVARGVRAALVEVFSGTGAFIGRNSPEAISVDLKESLKKIYLNNNFPIFQNPMGRNNNIDPLLWIESNILQIIDLDQHNEVYELSTYSFLNPRSGQGKQDPLYSALFRAKKAKK